MVIFENSSVLIVDKRPGFLSVVSRLGEKDPRPCEFLEWQKERGIRLWSVHRLDEEVSGILVLAKNPKAHALLSQAFESRTVGKTYEAWTEVGNGTCPEEGESFHWESFLLRGKKRAYEKPFGKKAVTNALFKGKGVILGTPHLIWELFPLTGRSHQLRFECFKHGFPILGDALYGSKIAITPIPGIALRATSLEFTDASLLEDLNLPKSVRANSIEKWADVFLA